MGAERAASAADDRASGHRALPRDTQDLVRRAALSAARPAVASPRHSQAPGHDLGRIRIHDTPEANAAAVGLGAAAWSAGRDVGLATRYRSDSPQRRHLIRHEIAHVAADRPSDAVPTGSMALADPEGAEEAAARRTAAGASLAGYAGGSTPGGHVVVHRAPEGSAATAEPAQQADLLADGEGFRWIGDQYSPSLIVRISWLEANGVPHAHGTLEIGAASHPAVIGPLIEALVRFCGWADHDRATANLAEARLLISGDHWAEEVVAVPVESSIFLLLGLPREAPVQVVHQGDGVIVYIDLVRLAGTMPAAPGDATFGAGDEEGAGTALGHAVAAAVVAALEMEFGQPINPLSRTAELDTLAKGVPATPRVYTESFTAKALIALFGEASYRAVAERAANRDSTGLSVRLPDGATVELPADVTDPEMATIRELLAEIGGPPDAGSQPQPSLTRADVDAVVLLAKAADRAAVVAALRAGTGGGDLRARLTDLIETARAQLDWATAANALGKSFDEAEREPPIVPRPVHGFIRNIDRLVPGLEAHFTFETTDQVYGDRVPIVKTHWLARPTAPGEPVVAEENTSYVEVRADSLLNDRIFEVTFKKPGTYEIHAFVDHNFFLPAHVTIQVEVVTETEILEEFRAGSEAAWGKETGSAGHRFEEIATDEALLTAALTAPGGGNVAGLESGYAEGTRAEGKLSPEAAKAHATLLTDRAQRLRDEIARLEKLAADYTTNGIRDDDTLLTAIADRRSRLADAAKNLEDLAAQGSAVHAVPTEAFFASRSQGVPSSRLSLVTYFTTTGSGAERRYEGHILDQSELLESQHYEWDRSAPGFAALMEGLFVDLTHTYPNGTISFAYQVWDDATQRFTDRFVRFERVTDTVGQDIHDVVFSPGASMLVNLGALLLTLFPPTAVIGITIGLAYNAASTVADIQADLRKGTLDAGKTTVQLLQLALDIIPVAGKATRLITIGTRTYRVFEGAQLLGNAYLLSHETEKQIETLRDTQIADLLRLQTEIAKLSETNASDRRLKDLRRQEQATLTRLREAATDLYAKAALEQGLMLGSMAVIRRVAEPVLSSRRPAADTDLGERRPPGRTDTDDQQPPPGRDTAEKTSEETSAPPPGSSQEPPTVPTPTTPPAFAPTQLPPNVHTGKLRRRALELINQLPDEAQLRITEQLQAMPPEKAGPLLTELGRLQDVKGLETAFAERAARAAGTDVEAEGPQPTGGGLDDSVNPRFDEEDGLRESGRKVSRISPTRLGFERSALKGRLKRAGAAPANVADGVWQAHHLIPVELENHPVLDALRANGGWDHNDARNGIALPTRAGVPGMENLPQHQVTPATFRDAGRPVPPRQTMRDLQGHPVWNEHVRSRLDQLETFMNRPDELRTEVVKLTDELRLKLETSVANGKPVLF